MVLIWLGVQVLAVALVLVPLFILVALPFSHEKAVVTADQVGDRRVWVVDLPKERILKVECPTVVEQLGGTEDPICRAKMHESIQAWLICLAVIVACVLAFLFARRRRRTLRRRRSPWVPTEQIVRYRRFGAPALFWVATASFGALTALIDVVVVLAIVDGSFDGNVRAPVWFTGTFVGLSAYFGWRHGYELEIDGDDLVWRAPMRSRRVALADLVGFTSGTKRRTEKERTMRILCRDGSYLSVSLPDRRHEWHFRRLVDALRLRVPLPELGPHHDDHVPTADEVAPGI
jgi:hypothetical protein